MSAFTLVSIRLIHMSCGECGIQFAIDEDKHTRCKENGEDWYCPNGHGRIYTKSENTKLKDQLGIVFWDGSAQERIQEVKKALNIQTSVSSPPQAESEIWQSSNPNKPNYIALSNIHTDGMPLPLLEFWSQVENWYGDISKKETGEQLLKRMLEKFTITRKP